MEEITYYIKPTLMCWECWNIGRLEGVYYSNILIFHYSFLPKAFGFNNLNN